MFTSVILGACLVLVTPQNSPSEDVCSLNREVGHCKAAIPAWYFDKASNECKTFTYSGCGGNENNFNSKEECDKRCATTSNEQMYIEALLNRLDIFVKLLKEHMRSKLNTESVVVDAAER